MANLVKIPAQREINIGRFRFTATGVEVTGRPSFAEWQAAYDFATRTHKGADWWIADLVAYGQNRADWEERLAQAMDAGDIEYDTVRTIKYVGESVPRARRRAAPWWKAWNAEMRAQRRALNEVKDSNQ